VREKETGWEKKRDNLWKTICDEMILQGLMAERAGRARGRGTTMHEQFSQVASIV
jgi:hypothetical protein